MYRVNAPRRGFSVADLFVLLLIGAVIAALSSFGREWRAEFHPLTHIDLSASALPRYAAFSALRGLLAYVLSLGFTLIVGYWAAHSKPAERILIPLLDILQSIPVLGFLPGLVIGLIAIFPNSNVGLELSAIIMIFTGQVWNMTFSYYSSLKSVPGDLREAASVMGLSWRQKLLNIELPFSAAGLAWNSLMSMAGGWFFLSVCEAFSLGKQQYRLPGVGAYMAEAVAAGDTRAMVLGVLAMVCIIVGLDIFIWRPALAWVHRFRLENMPGTKAEIPLMTMVYRDALLLRVLKSIYRGRRRYRTPDPTQRLLFAAPLKRLLPQNAALIGTQPIRWGRIAVVLGVIVATALSLWGCLALVALLARVSRGEWGLLLIDTFWTFTRVVATLVLSSLWAVPVGIWIGTSPRRIRIAQPLIQVMASFPAPMLYPLALAVFFKLALPFEVGSLFLMMLGVQWYVLFNVLAGAMRVPAELRSAMKLMNVSKWDRWKNLYIPSVFPALVTGWVTAAGGAWNASIVAEYVAYDRRVLIAHGLGARISVAASAKNFEVLAASLTIMVVVVIGLNRGFWARIYHLAQTRYRMDL